MLNVYHEPIDVHRILELQQTQYQNGLYFEEEIPASGQVDGSVNVTSLGHYMLLGITGSFTTLIDDGQGAPVDNGVNPIFFQLVDGSNQRTLFDDFAAAPLILSPGRVKGTLAPVTAADRSGQLYLEFPWCYTFPMNSQILVKVKNESDWPNTLRLFFHGIRIFPRNRQNQ